ncbi:MAG: EAL domain-containing protein [Candidatus Magnetoovum sp. WYHC-5]|nr:EAL domain-containing protein [Candidatus Magnetoovum sp. WYHC-5]
MDKEVLLDAILRSSINMAIVAVDTDYRIEYYNLIAEDVFGYKASDVIGKTVMQIHEIERVDPTRFFSAMQIVKDVGSYTYTFKRKVENQLVYFESRVTGIWDNKNNLVGYVVMFRDITERVEAQERLSQLAHYDPLTNIPNRMLFNDRLTHAMTHAKRQNKSLALLFIDLDRFKNINDTLGHEIGDLLLKETALRLKSCIRESDTVARMGGDEFTVILTNITMTEDASTVAAKIIKTLSDPFYLKCNECMVGASVGISLYPTDSTDGSTLLKYADLAMYKVKEKGRNDYQFYSAGMNKDALLRLRVENLIRNALDKEEFIVLYEPQVDINTGRLVGFETILRWKNPQYNISPAEYIPVAEETGLIEPIGKWMLREVCRQGKIWKDEGLPNIYLAVKMLPQQFKRKDIVEVVHEILTQTNYPPDSLDIALTENIITTNVSDTIKTFTALKRLGVHITIDDFGSGYSSLANMKRLPVNTIKINKHFVHNITTDTDYAALASAIIAFAHSLKLRVIAEGVKTLGQLEYLRSIKCDEVQGELFSFPVDADSIRAMLLDEIQFNVHK